MNTGMTYIKHISLLLSFLHFTRYSVLKNLAEKLNSQTSLYVCLNKSRLSISILAASLTEVCFDNQLLNNSVGQSHYLRTPWSFQSRCFQGTLVPALLAVVDNFGIFGQ